MSRERHTHRLCSTYLRTHISRNHSTRSLYRAKLLALQHVHTYTLQTHATYFEGKNKIPRNHGTRSLEQSKIFYLPATVPPPPPPPVKSRPRNYAPRAYHTSGYHILRTSCIRTCDILTQSPQKAPPIPISSVVHHGLFLLQDSGSISGRSSMQNTTRKTQTRFLSSHVRELLAYFGVELVL